MKALNILLIAFAILIFSGCYTQLLIEDDPPTSVTYQPLPPPTEPIVIYVPEPRPIEITGPISGPYIPPAKVNPIVTTPAPMPVRTTGVQRSDPGSSQTSSQNTTRNSGATRSGR